LSEERERENENVFNLTIFYIFFSNRDLFMVAHENQLTDLEEAIKKEFNLLHSFRGSKMEFDDYLKQVDEMLSKKVHSIRDFQNQISQLRSYSTTTTNDGRPISVNNTTNN
jgi:hypothetical protein